jgi:hypothetical protein
MNKVFDINRFDEKFTSTELFVVKALFRGERISNASSFSEDEVLKYSAQNGVAALLYKRLREADDGSMPDKLLQRLKNEYLKTLVQNTNLLNKAVKINSLLEKNGVPVVFLKGIIVAPFCYKDTALRPMSDIDLLIPEQDVQKAYDLLLSEGAVKADPVEKDHPSNHHLPMIVFKSAPVEVHRFLTSKDSDYFIPPDDIFKNRILWSDGKFALPGPSYVDIFIYMIVHVYYTFLRGGMRLSWMYDFLLLQGMVDVKSSEFTTRVKEWKVEYPVLLMLTLLELLKGRQPSFPGWESEKKLMQDILLSVSYLHEEPADSMLLSYRLIWEQIKNAEGIENKLKIFRTKLFRRSDENILSRFWKLSGRFTGMLYNSTKLSIKRYFGKY